ncbi:MULTISPECIES: hypothetical protein [Haloarcula]|uniref:Uncharacterized protein n=1 Tax=Haloarcula pellucida TaxID=1427151 RepID=A0A830GRZ1_9EURY|nr:MULTISPECIES: hypothetical protein [Halomicroarcula]MBX0350544.1 hypothetical protein [Halomicroarcula pellucida]MDS0280311.1 hypothetical protein [Halomicroarcula sp. S1AR25-4]GGO03827.1 hypothetical protein GCM10009030_39910 [Halomicroarcula pellucida]
MGNGMKSGSGEDPFADVDGGDGDDETEDEVDAVKSATGDEVEVDEGDENSGNGGVSSGYPWLFTRNNAKDGREMVQFFLQQETQQLESQAQADLESMLGEEPLVLDIREAAYQVALEQHLDDVADQLREWGYDAE